MYIKLQSFHQAVSQLDADEEEILEEEMTLLQVVYHDRQFSIRIDMMQLSFIVFRRADSLY